MTGLYRNLLLLSLAVCVVCMLVSLADAEPPAAGQVEALSGRSGAEPLALRDRRDTSVNNGNDANGDNKKESDRTVRKQRCIDCHG